MADYSFNKRKYTKNDVGFNRAPVENILFSNDGKASIVLGGDRIKNIDSGYGGLGFEDSSAIDIVCGRGKTIKPENKQNAFLINPDFFSDAARIYISEKTNIDKNFALAKGKIGDSVSESAIALKADSIRIIGVNGIKLVTRANPSNSNDSESGVKGIELIAGNDDTFLQPMVKGDNLVSCLIEITEVISHVKGQVHSIMNFLESFVNNYNEHVHLTAPVGPPSQSPNALIVKGIFEGQSIIHSSEDNYLSDIISSIRSAYLKNPSLDRNILSPYNKTN